MFEKRDPFPWKIPVLILTGIVVLSGGIYIGVKTQDVKDKENITASVNKEKEKIKEVYGLSKDCEIWLHKKNEDGSDSKKSPVMIGTVDKSLLDKSEEEIRSYLKDKYPDRKVDSLSKFKINLSETMEINDTSKINKYTLESNNEFIGLYKYDNDGNKSLFEKTEIHIDSLPKTVQEEIRKGIIVNTTDEAYMKLENFGS
ncbi:MAG: hypothetical protein RR942_07485 [Romboutsia sp.]